MDDYPESRNESATIEAMHKELVEFLKNSSEMKKTVRSSFKQSLYAGGAAMAGGMTFGPIGGLVGGIAGSLLGFVQAEDYDGAVLALGKVDGGTQERLVNNVGDVLKNAGATAQKFRSVDAFKTALAEYSTQKQVREQVWDACSDALR